MNIRTRIKWATVLLFVALSVFISIQGTRAQSEPQDAQIQGVQPQAADPIPSAYLRPDYNYKTPLTSCAMCHFKRPNGGGDHNSEAVGLVFDDATYAWKLTGNGWLASKHSQTNEGETQNTYCAKCHSPLEAKPDAEFKFGKYQEFPEGSAQAVTCNVCHPGHAVQDLLGGRRLGIYKAGTDPLKAENWESIAEGNEDLLCLNCHTTRHNEQNAAFQLMYAAEVRCIDCHMPVYGKILGTDKDKRTHDWKVGKNLPFSCGVEGSVTHCHPDHSVEATRMLIPYLKEQHEFQWADPKLAKKLGKGSLKSAKAYLVLWNQFEDMVKTGAASPGGK